jgi:hypothetical protein
MRKAILAAGGLTLALALSACGGGQPAASSAASSGAPAAAAAGDSAPAGDLATLVKNSEAALAAKKSAKFTLSATEDDKAITGTGQAQYGDKPATAMTVQSDGQTTEILLIDNSLYMKLPAAQAAATGTTKPWLKLPGGDDNPTAKALSGSLGDAASGSDPAKALALFEKAGKITSSDKTQLAGKPATHYVIDVDYSKVPDQLPAGIPAQVRDALKGKAVHSSTELWLDDDQLPVQVVTDVAPLLKASGLPTTGSKATVTYSDWGTPVTVQAPPDDQVTDFAAMLKNMGGSTPPTP